MSSIDMRLIPPQERANERWGKKLADALKGHVGSPKNLGPKSFSKTYMRVKLKEVTWCWETDKGNKQQSK